MSYHHEKTSLPLLFLVSLLTTSAGVINKTYNFSPGQVSVNPITQEDGTYSEVTYNGLDNLSAIGEPRIPVKSVLFKVPDNAVNITVSAQLTGGTTIILPDSILYSLPITSDGVSGTIQRLSTTYPYAQAELTNIGYIGGNRKVVGVNIYPLSVAGDGMTVIAYDQVKVKISYSTGSETDLSALTPKNPKLRTEINNFLKANVENPLLVDASPIDPGITPLTVDQEEYEYLIITPARYEKSMERLAAMRRCLGHSAKVVSLESIMSFTASNYPNNEINDDAGKLRYFIKYAYERFGTTNVLLAGKFSEMPVRYAWEYLGSSYHEIESRIPSDIYFADLNSVWIPGLKSETFVFSSSAPDIYNEVNVGRLNISSNPQQEIDNYINKIKKYEFVNPLQNPDYYGNAIMSMRPESQRFYNYFYSEAKQSLESVFNTGLTDISPRNSGEILTGSQFINLINTQHPGAIALYGHGNAGTIGLDNGVHYLAGIDAYDKWITPEPGNGLDNLTIPDYPSWFFSVACYIMPYDYMDEDGTELTLPYNFGDAYTIANATGGVSLFGNTRASYIEQGRSWSKAFFSFLNQNANLNNRISYAGDILFKSLYYMVNPPSYSKYFREYYTKGLTGDPLCRIRVKEPTPLQISGPSFQVDGTQKYRIETTEDSVFTARQPFIDATYAIKFCTAINDSIIVYDNEVTSVYTSNSAPYVLPLYLRDFEWWNYSCKYIFANNVYIGKETDSATDNVFISSGNEVTIEAMGDVNINYGLYIRDNATLNIIADGNVSFTTIHMGQNATLNITAWDITDDKGWAINDGQYQYTFTRLCEQNQVATQEDGARSVAANYQPMVVEGRTWWIHTDGYLGWWDKVNYKDYEIGFTIGSEVKIDGEKWHKLYISHYRELTQHPDGVMWNEDESVIGYMREADKRVYVKLNWEHDLEHLLGSYAQYIPYYYINNFNEAPFQIYDFSSDDGHFFIGESDFIDDRTVSHLTCKYISHEVIENSGLNYTKYHYNLISAYYEDNNLMEDYFFTKAEIVEGIGLTSSEDLLLECLFFLPFADNEFHSLSNLMLRYVTDKDNNIIYEHGGGTKLWDEMSGVHNVAMPSTGDNEMWYNLQGVRIQSPNVPGVYLLRSGGECRKVVIK